jgi:hypothetical protein
MIIRSLYTTHINLENYGLGTKGSAALAVALVVNFQKKKIFFIHIIQIYFIA